MRKLKLQMQVSLDGFNSTGPNDEQQWVTWDLDSVRPHVLALLDSIDTILIGRKLAVDYIPYWQDAVKSSGHPMHDFAIRIVSAQKVVFTKTLEKSIWENTELAQGGLVEEVNRLKARPGKDIIVYGGSSFAAALAKEGLIDEFNFFINPVALGSGESLFSGLTHWQKLELKHTEVLESGIILLRYEPR